jgi:hypothetical protein
LNFSKEGGAKLELNETAKSKHAFSSSLKLTTKKGSVSSDLPFIESKFSEFREQDPSPAPIKLDNIWYSDNESVSETDSQSSETSSQETAKNRGKPFNYFEFILGIITGLLISLCIAFADAIQYTQLNTPL